MGGYSAPPPPSWDPRAVPRPAGNPREQRRALRYQARAGRRGSIVGPLLLIAVGTVFLLIEWGHLGYRPVLAWYGRWWPVVFLAAGGVMLAEWAWDQRRIRQGAVVPYRRSLGGGAFLLLLALAFVGLFSHAFWHLNGDPFYRSFHLNPDDLDQFLGDKHESEQVLAFPYTAGAALQISDSHGNISVRGTSDDGQIHATVHKEVYTRSDSDAERRAADLVPKMGNSGSTMTLEVPSVQGGRADLILTVPPGAALTATADHGQIRVAGMRGAVAVTANHGDIDLSALTGPATVHINGGASSFSAHSLGNGITIEGRAQEITLADVKGPVSINGDFFGTTHLQHIAGSVHFRTTRTDLQLARLDGELEVSPHMDLSAAQAMGPFILTTSNRNILLDRVAGPVSVTNRNGSIELTAAPSIGAITLADRNGSVKTTLPESSGFTVQATTTDGDISTDLPLSPQAQGNRRQLQGTIGSGGPLVQITTSHGDISVNKGVIAPLPAVAPALPRLSAEPSAMATRTGPKRPGAGDRNGAQSASGTGGSTTF